MKPVLLDFGRLPPERWHWLCGHRRGVFRWAVPALLALATGLLVAQLQALWAVQRDLAETRQALAQAVQPFATPAQGAARAAAKDDHQRLQLAARTIRQLNTPWPALFDALESAAHPDVALVALEPDVRKSSVRVITEARSLDALLAHARQVSGTPPFTQVTLVRHEPNEQDPQRPLRLHFDAALQPHAASRTGDTR